MSLFNQYEVISRSGLFDARYYAATYPDAVRSNADPLLHYLEAGAKAGLNPSAAFDSAFYLDQCKKLGESPANPLFHFLTEGKRRNVPINPEMARTVIPMESTADEKLSRKIEKLPPLRLQVDEAIVDDDGVLTVAGWALCFLDITDVRLFIGDKSLGSAVLGQAREDVATAHGIYPKAGTSGFFYSSILEGIVPGKTTLRVEATAQNGVKREAAVPVTVPKIQKKTAEDVLHYHCDSVELGMNGALSIKGWVVCGRPTKSIAVFVDGRKVGVAELGIERADVGNMYPRHAHARSSGFTFSAQLKQEVSAGEHVVTLKVLDGSDLSHELPLPVTAVERRTTPEPAVVGGGAIDRALYIDAPRLIDGAAESAITGSLSIGGWALAGAGVKSIDIEVDGKVIAHAHHGIRRDDVAAIHQRPDALMSGFATLVPNWVLPKGERKMRVILNDKSGKSESVEFRVEIREAPEGDGPWTLRRKMSAAEADMSLGLLDKLDWNPTFIITLRANWTDRTAVQRARVTLRSLQRQEFRSWRVLVGSSIGPKARLSLLEGLEDIADRIIFLGKGSNPVDLAKLVNSAPEKVFASVVTAGDELGCDALLEMATVTGVERDAGFFYSDERRVNPVSRRMDAYFKPAWSPDLLLSTNYVGRLWVTPLATLRKASVGVQELLSSGDLDLVLKVTEVAGKVQHVSKVLCEQPDTAGESPESEKQALAGALRRRKIEGSVEPGCAEGFYRVKRKVQVKGRVSIIIPTCAARGLVKTCIETVRKKTAYKNYEIICIENIPPERAEWKKWLRKNADKVLTTAEPFNWSRFNNLCVAEATGEFLLFLNDDIEVLDPNWMHALLEHAQRPEVGVVGPQLLYGDRSVQHAGMALTRVGQARHIFRHARRDDPGYFGLALTQRNVIGVTGACLLSRREVFDKVGRFDEAHTIVNNDIDYCLKTWKHGYLNVYTPHTTLIHHELASRGELGDVYDTTAFAGEWKDDFLRGDPYFNPHLSREVDDLTAEREPLRVVRAGNPLYRRDSIKRILVVKLDHIGDVVTILPAFRRLRRLFPKAEISVMANRATKAIWSLEKGIKEIIEFDFFHARSGLGKKELDEDHFNALARTLATKEFDLAIDMRKSPDTRSVLQRTGARLLAGFDSVGRCPWLDIAIEWEGDPRYSPKRQHVGDDMINLVDAIAASADRKDELIQVPEGAELGLPPKDQKKLFGKPVVCIHPASGTEMRQWPPEYFAELIDLILAEHDVNVAILGGPDEMPIAQKVFDASRNAKRLFNLVGKLKLSEVPTFLSRCALFVGNNSGPKHIAGALGIPTVGVHSGVIDSKEWGPLGPNAIAVRRDMSCSPCYMEKKNDCPKNLACLRLLSAGDILRVCSPYLAISSRVMKRIKGAN